MRKFILFLFAISIVLIAGNSSMAQTPVPMASQPSFTYTENFADITNWTNNFAAGTGANRWLGFAPNATGTIPDGVRTTATTLVFQATSTSGGVQRGGLASSNNPAGTIVMLATGTPQNTTAAAIEVFLDFTGTTAGTLSFDWSRVNNSTGDRIGSLKVFTSTDGTTYTELTGAAVSNLVNNGGTASGSITTVQLPSSFDNSATARVRFYYFNGSTNGTTGSRPKIAIDNLVITSTSAGTPTISLNTTGFNGSFGGVTFPASSSPSSYVISGLNLEGDITITPPVNTGMLIRTGVASFSSAPIVLTPSSGTVSATTIDVMFSPIGTGHFTGNITHTSTNATQQNLAVDGYGLSQPATVQASNITFSSVTATSFTVNFTPGNGDRRLVVLKAGSAVDGVPTNGITYSANSVFSTGQQIGSGNYVVYYGNGSSVDVTGLSGGVNYHATVYEFNGTSGAENYNITAPPVNNQLTTAPIPSVVVNKYQNGTPDAIELLVYQDNLDMRGMIIKDFSSNMTGDGGGKFQFTADPIWASVRSGTLIILRNNATAADSVAGGMDYTLDIGLTNTIFFTNLGGSFDISTTDMIMIKAAGSDFNGTAGAIHTLAGGTAGTLFTATGNPKLIATGTTGANFFAYANNTNSVISDFSGTDATGNATGLTFGAGNNAANTAFINSLKNITISGNTSIPAGTYGSLIINGSGAVVTFSGDVVINGILTLTDGLIQLDGNNLTANGISGGNATSYVQTNGAGRLTINNVGATNTLFPVGNTSYNPVTINNGGTADNFSVSVQNTIDNPTPDNTQAVQRQWNISEAVAGGSNVVLTFQWAGSEEGAGVVRGSLVIGHFTGGAYTDVPCNPVAGSDPYTITSTGGVTSFSPFILGNMAIAPVELSSFSSNVTRNNVKLNWSTISEENNSGFDVERKNSNGVWTKITNVAGNGTTNIAHSYTFEDRNLLTGKYNYRLKQIDFNGNYKYYELSNEVVVGIPSAYALSQNYPNPFNPSTTINYELPKSNFVSLKVYDMMGREVANLVNQTQDAGFYSIKFDASKLTSGIYFYKIQAADFSAVKKLMLVK